MSTKRFFVGSHNTTASFLDGFGDRGGASSWLVKTAFART
jgi:hypothetical protein